MLSAAGATNCSPTGLNFTAFTPCPVGAVIVIAVGLRSAPGGTVSQWGPAVIVPPNGPIVTVFESYGRFEHLRRPGGPSNDPMRAVHGVGAWGWVGSVEGGGT